jgi:hypothetical protein
MSYPRKEVIRKKEIHRLPVHTTLLQDGPRDDSSLWHTPPLTHLLLLSSKRRGTVSSSLLLWLMLEVTVTLFLSLESSQTVLGKVETPAPLSSNTVLIKVVSFLSVTSKVSRTRRVGQPPVSHLLSALQRPVDEEDEDEESDGSQRRDNTDNGILSRLASVRSSTRLSAVATTSTRSTTTGDGVADGDEIEASVDLLCEGTGNRVSCTSVEARVLGLDECSKRVDLIRGNVTEPHGAQLVRVLRRPVSAGDVNLQSIALDTLGYSSSLVKIRNSKRQHLRPSSKADLIKTGTKAKS